MLRARYKCLLLAALASRHLQLQFIWLAPAYRYTIKHIAIVIFDVNFELMQSNYIKLTLVLTDPHTGKALVIANQSRNVRSNIKRSDYSAVRAAYRSLAAFFIDLRPK